MNSIESSGKNVREAIESGLKRLDKSLGEVEVKILSQGGLLRKARVMITVLRDDNDASEFNIEELGKVRTRPEKDDKHYNDLYKAYAHKIPDDEEKQPKKEDKPFTKSDKPFTKTDKPFKKEEKPFTKTDKPFKKEEKPFNKDKRPKPDKNFEKEKRPKRTDEDFCEITQEIKLKAEGFLREVLAKMGVENALTSEIKEKQLCINIESESGTVIGYRGETLSALEYLTTLSLNRNNNFYRVSVDCNGYREKREQSLISLAERMGAKAIKTGRKVVLEPMSSVSRKVIHSVLANNEALITRSEGSEPNRRIVIIPKRNAKREQ